MIFKARVIDNSMFEQSGKIRVRIFEKCRGKEALLEDLSIAPEVSIKSMVDATIRNDLLEVEYKDQEAFVAMPFGGGLDYGFFHIPQVNSIGIVSTFGDEYDPDNNGKYIWLGGLYENSTQTIPEDAVGTTEENRNSEDDNDSTTRQIINIPSDKEEQGYSGIENETNLLNDRNCFLIKLKGTNLDDVLEPEYSKDDMDWKKIPFTNMILLDKDKNELYYYIDSETVETFKMDIDGIHSTVNDYSSNASFDLSASSIKLYKRQYKKTENKKDYYNTVNINCEDDAIEITTTNTDDKSLSVVIDGESLTITRDKVTFTITDEGISIESPVVKIQSENIKLGDGDRPVLLSNSKLAINLPEGIVASSNITG